MPLKRSSIWEQIHAALLCMTGLVLILYPLFCSGFARMPTDPGDTRLNNYILEQGYQWIQGHAKFWDPSIFHPVSGTLAYSDILLGTAPIYWIFRALGFLPDTSHQLWIGVVLVTGFFAARLVLRKTLGIGSLAASLAAFVFAFGNPRGAQLNHQQMLPQMYSWFCGLALFHLFNIQSTHPKSEAAKPDSTELWIAFFWGSFVLQIYAGFYLGWFLALGLTALALSAGALKESRGRLISAWRAFGLRFIVGGIIAGIALLPMAIPYIRTGRELGFRRFADVKPMLPRINSWFFSGRESWLYGWEAKVWPWRETANSLFAHEHVMGAGFLTFILAAWGLWRNRSRIAIRVLIVATLGVAMSVTLLFPRVTIWGILYPVMPGASGIRAMARIGLLFLIPTSVGLALAFDRLLSLKTPIGRRWLPLVLGLAVILEQGRAQSSYDKTAVREDVERLSLEVKRLKCPSFFYSPVLPSSANEPVEHYPLQLAGATPWAHRVPWKYHLDAMWAQMETGIPTWNGYSGNFPREWWSLLFQNVILTSSDENRIAEGLRRWATLNNIPTNGSGGPLGECWIRLNMNGRNL